jgi:hypothetical protein
MGDCGAIHPDHPGTHCRQPDGHSGPHMTARRDVEWDNAYLSKPPAPPAPLDAPVRGVLARAWKRRAKMYKSLYLRHLNEMGQWRSALRLAGIGQMGDLNPDAIRLTITVPSEKRINEMVEERIAAIRDATPAPLDVERLARALIAARLEWGSFNTASEYAAAIAAAYAEETA